MAQAPESDLGRVTGGTDAVRAAEAPLAASGPAVDGSVAGGTAGSAGGPDVAPTLPAVGSPGADAALSAEPAPGAARAASTPTASGSDGRVAPGPVAEAAPATKAVLAAEAATTDDEAPAHGAHSGRLTGSTFAMMAHRDFRLLWLSTLGTGAGWWMDTVTRGWLIYQLTGSATQLGLVNAVRAVPFLLLGMFAGVAADRWDRKRQLQISQVLTFISNFLMAVLVVTGHIEVWHVYVAAIVSGASQAFMQPARQAMIPALVPREGLMNAIALSSGAFSITKTAGPALAGVLVALIGVVGTYLVQSAMYVWACVNLAMLHAPEPRRRSTRKRSVLGDLGAGLTYVRGDAVILTLLLLALIPAVLGSPYYFLLPIIADQVLGAGPSGLGLLAAAPGIGSLVAVAVLAWLGDFRRKGLLMLTGAITFGCGLILFSQSRWLPLSCLLLMVVGMAQSGYNAINMTLMQKLVPDRFRGRVISLLLLDRGMVPLGAATIGVLGDLWGPSQAVLFMGVLCALVAATAMVRMPHMRALE
jgi:MFS transporter, DHA1 family, staphyloferrin A biosynthesis exporter